MGLRIVPRLPPWPSLGSPAERETSVYLQEAERYGLTALRENTSGTCRCRGGSNLSFLPPNRSCCWGPSRILYTDLHAWKDPFCRRRAGGSSERCRWIHWKDKIVRVILLRAFTSNYDWGAPLLQTFRVRPEVVSGNSHRLQIWI
jgi:hypothetical protein